MNMKQRLLDNYIIGNYENPDGKSFATYKIIDQTERVLYCGLSKRPYYRMWQHLRKKPGGTDGHGIFYGRTDVKMQVIAWHENRKIGRIEEDKLRVEYGFLTEGETIRNGIFRNHPKKEKPVREKKGGKGIKRPPFSEEWKMKMSQASKGKKKSPQHVENARQALLRYWQIKREASAEASQTK